MKIEKNKEKLISMRMRQEDYEKLLYVARSNGFTFSEYIRCLVRGVIDTVDDMLKAGELTYEDIQTICND